MPRQELVSAYWNARNSVNSDDLENSVYWLNKYIQLLPNEISHEPQYWLTFQYLKMGDGRSAFEAAKLYLEGCKYPHAANMAKKFSVDFKKRDFIKFSTLLLGLSKHYAGLQEKSKKVINENL